jgi:hypothetical protein
MQAMSPLDDMTLLIYVLLYSFCMSLGGKCEAPHSRCVHLNNLIHGTVLNSCQYGTEYVVLNAVVLLNRHLWAAEA